MAQGSHEPRATTSIFLNKIFISAGLTPTPNFLMTCGNKYQEPIGGFAPTPKFGVGASPYDPQYFQAFSGLSVGVDTSFCFC